MKGNRPTAAPSHFPYREHRTVAETLQWDRPRGDWTPAEIQTLREWRKAGLPITATARQLGRSYGSVAEKIRRLGW